MDLARILVDLRRELDSLNAAISCLERLQGVRPRRGRAMRILSSIAKPDRPLAKRSRTRFPVRTRKR